jgi:hypothetical protein
MEGVTEVPFKFEYDSSSGKYGYRDGADTFRPFNDGSGGSVTELVDFKNNFSGTINRTTTTTKYYSEIYVYAEARTGTGQTDNVFAQLNNLSELKSLGVIYENINSSPQGPGRYYSWSFFKLKNVPSGTDIKLSLNYNNLCVIMIGNTSSSGAALTYIGRWTVTKSSPVTINLSSYNLPVGTYIGYTCTDLSVTANGISVTSGDSYGKTGVVTSTSCSLYCTNGHSTTHECIVFAIS